MTVALLGTSSPKRLSIDVGSRGDESTAHFSFRAARFGFGELNVTAPSAEWLEKHLPIIRNELHKLGPRWMWVFGNVMTFLTTLIGVPLVTFGLLGLLATTQPLESLAVLAAGLFFSIPVVFPRLRIMDRPVWRGRGALIWVWTLLAGAVAGAVVSQIMSGWNK